MKKIGIITIQRSEVNYGACLQCYALWLYINKCLGQCRVIDLLRPCHKKYIPSKKKAEKSNVSTKQKIKLFLNSIFNNQKLSSDERNRLLKFKQFNEKVLYSKQFRSIDELYETAPDYDVYVSGSDQIWNPYRPFNNEPYLLGFVKDGKKRVSYASSFGVGEINADCKIAYKDLLGRFSNISVREESGAQIVEDIVGTKPEVVLDPVFLLTKEQWQEEQCKPMDLIKGKYVFLYMLKYDEAVLNYASSIAREKGLPLYMVLSENKTVDTQLAKQLVDIGPAEWLWLIDNADNMITTSFHGTAFSIIFKTPLLVMIKKGQSTNSRIETLLSKFGLLSFINEIKAPYSERIIDYDYLYNNMTPIYEKECLMSKAFLSKAISND